MNNLKETVLKDINDNLDKNINIGNINLINKQKQLELLILLEKRIRETRITRREDSKEDWFIKKR